MALKVPHNVFAAWMVSPLSAGACSRPMDMLDSMALLQSSLAAFADRYRPVENDADAVMATLFGQACMIRGLQLVLGSGLQRCHVRLDSLGAKKE